MTRVAIAGAGSIGCYVGGLLADHGHDVRFLARPRIAKAAAQEGLRLTDYKGLDVTLALKMEITPDALSEAEVILVTVKSAATAEMAHAIAAHASKSALILSLQNGVANAATLRAHLPDHDVRAAMVPFNVVPTGPAAFHRGTSGDILVQAGPLPDLNTPHLQWQSVDNIESVQWGKLLINLGNAVNALSGLTLLDQLHDRAWRRVMADQMAEGLRVLRAAGIQPAKTTAAPPALLPHILRLPRPLFNRIAAQMLTIDPHARSSMWDDLTQRRTTEVDALQGALIALGAQHGVATPLMAHITALVKAAEAQGDGPPGLTPQDLRP